MKKFFVAMFALVAGVATAQDVKGLMVEDFPDTIEITVTKRLFSDNVNVNVDAGQDTAFINFAGRKNYALTHEGSNNRLEFTGTADVLSYFKGMGYDVASVNGYAYGNKGNSFLVKLLGIPGLSRGQRLILSKAGM